MARGPAKARAYSATEPLFARDTLRFSGRVVELRAQVPEEYWQSQRARHQFWDHRKVDHARDLPPKRSPVASAAPAALPAATAQAAEAPIVHVQPKEALEAAAAAARPYGLSVTAFGGKLPEAPAPEPIAEPAPVVHVAEQTLTEAELERLTAPAPPPVTTDKRRGRSR